MSRAADPTSPLRVVPVPAEHVADFEAVDDITWFDEQPPPGRRHVEALDPDRLRAATRDGAPPYLGIYATDVVPLTVPGPGETLTQVPADALTWVAVHPDHRRRGVLSTMIAAQLREAHDAGLALACLHASESAIYGRFGYGAVGTSLTLTVPSGRAIDAPGIDDSDVTTELRTVDQGEVGALLHELQHRFAAGTLGQVGLTERRNLHYSVDDPAWLRGKERQRVLIARRGEDVVGYCILRREGKWEGGGPAGVLHLGSHGYADDAAELAILRRLLSFDLIAKVELRKLAVDSPVPWWLGGLRGLDVQASEALWLRVVDVPAALTARGYAAPVDVVLEIEDDLCPWNAGHWRLTVGDDGRATCAPTSDPADLGLSVRTLGVAFLGGRTVRDLRRQGVILERTPGAAAALHAAMAASHQPIGANDF
ncbi:GNAT family N-acetyltransferase [Janibacter sp. G56]|uniref:GNAT family N-acetyltransferase n=1 Tax=Janibacter sp. G56 TaxID=3418717 RepID=UPI003CFC8E1A